MDEYRGGRWVGAKEFWEKPLPDHDDIASLLRRSAEQYNAMTQEQKRDLHRAQRKSWVVGEMMLGHPEMTREEAEGLYDKLFF